MKYSLSWKHCKNHAINQIYSFKNSLRFWKTKEDDIVEVSGMLFVGLVLVVGLVVMMFYGA